MSLSVIYRMEQLLEESEQERKTRRQQILKEKEMMKKLSVVMEDKEGDIKYFISIYLFYRYTS